MREKDVYQFLKQNHIHELIQKGSVDSNELISSIDLMIFPELTATNGSPDEMLPVREKPVILVVEDNACGMSEEVKAKLFEAFFSTKGKRGTGLGLMVVARTAKMHQGTVKVESQPGVGTKFILTLPRTFASQK